MNTILISGANSQIGSFLARAYEAEGHKLILLYHQRTDRINDLISPKIQVDLRDLDALEQKLLNHLKSIDCLIHCAAIRSEDHQAMCDINPQIFRRVLEDNVYPVYNLLKTILPDMRSRAFGRIVLFTSDVTRTGLANGSAYAAAKAAIANMAKSAALENAGRNILINCLAPGPVETNMEEDYNSDYLEFRKEYFKKHLERTASGKLVTKQEIKAVADMLISPLISNLCGEEIIMNGGSK
ncbi:MAG: SDR family NAD(P)-dependent oxidoreductase [Candidatus Cloacimonetes bacterium]|jgi:3-oxoacyl-[acyl-carrier protein] reductase|nr:SDR family oxidoreductase [Candidatus Cloacimonadota bacterium]MDD2506733.1 SDR family NAD(P)-dependent oxidoreductase [Candidatus Cloacimonadota bacterium]MDD4147382.1 SDR family NAD(P)-dependent oxidoreductase [Candidatus Cloacimonadota bacterium]MDD4559791.1 SDR family NAD(P)-dependent oxidoreductase [Candidatus Cloacimonadota bacterium]